MQDMSSGMVVHDMSAGMIGFVVGGAIIGLIITIAFCWSLYSTLARIPEDKQTMPAWSVWLMFIPLVGYIFGWILIPFSIPKSLKNAVGQNPEANQRINTLQKLGIGQLALPFLSWIPYLGLLFALGSVICWVVYWVKLLHIRDTYL